MANDIEPHPTWSLAKKWSSTDKKFQNPHGGDVEKWMGDMGNQKVKGSLNNYNSTAGGFPFVFLVFSPANEFISSLLSFMAWELTKKFIFRESVSYMKQRTSSEVPCNLQKKIG